MPAPNASKRPSGPDGPNAPRSSDGADRPDRPDRWLFADQLGPHFLDNDDQRVVLVESRGVFRRRSYHRRKAHLVLSALRHRAAELGDRATLVQGEGYGEALAGYGHAVEVVQPTSRAADAFVRSRPEVVDVLPARGFCTSQADFAAWAAGRGGRRLLLEDFYRDARRRHGVLVEPGPDGPQPVSGRWNLDADNRERPPKGARRLGPPEPWWPEEDAIDAQVREDLDRWQRDEGIEMVGADGPRRFPVTRAEAQLALADFLEHRLAAFGPHEDAMLHGDRWMAHSTLSVPINLGLLDPLEVVHAAERAHYDDPGVPLQSAEGFIRQILGWRDYIWHLYWHLGPEHRSRNALAARVPLPEWFRDLHADEVDARCLSWALDSVREEAWTHHIPRLMLLGNWALQRGYDPDGLTDWFHTRFADGYDWVMGPNVVGMSQHADGGIVATKPYAAGGAYIDRMSDFCGDCRYDPRKRVGEDACPFTAGYWWFLHRNRERLVGNHRMAQALRGLDRLTDLDALVEQEQDRGDTPP